MHSSRHRGFRSARAATGLLAAALALRDLPAQSPSPAPPPRALIGAVVDSAVAHGFTGTVLVASADRVIFDRSIGVPPSAVWRWASVTKQVTAALVMRAVDARQIALDTPVVRYLPWWRGTPAVTVRHLLQHTSGIPNLDDSPQDADGVLRYHRLSGKAVGNAAASRGICNAPSDSVPGRWFSYNNCDYLLLGALLDARTGRTYEAQVGTVARVSRGAAVGGFLVDGTKEPPVNIASWGASGALLGTARDLLTFDRALLSGRLMSDSARTAMWAGEPRFGYAALGAWSFPAALSGCKGDVPLIERRGEILGTQVRNIIAPTLGRIVIIFTNRAAVQFGEIWQGRGLSHDVMSAAVCHGE